MASPTKAKSIVLLASEWGSKRGGLSTFNRVLAIQLAKQPEVQVSVLVPRCTQDENDAAKNDHGVALVQAKKMVGFDDELDWLSFPPDDLQIDFVVGHGVVLGKYAQAIKDSRHCKWIQFVHTEPEELGMHKEYDDAISKGEKKHHIEVALCEKADRVVAVGPKLAEAYRSYLRPYGKDQDVFELTPGLFSEFLGAVQSGKDLSKCRVLAFGRGDTEDFSIKGFDLAAEAVGKVRDAQLIFVGAQDKSQAEVADRLKKCGIPPNRLRIRTFKECREDLKKQFSEVDIAIMPSRTEGFGLVALEAMSAGLPVLVSDNSGLGEALKKVKFGSHCVFPSDDAKVLADKIKGIWDKDRATRLEEAKDMCQNYGEKYSWEEQCRKLVEEILKESPPQKEPRTSARPRDSSADQSESVTMENEGSPPEKEPRTSARPRDSSADQPESVTMENEDSKEVSFKAVDWLSRKIGKWEPLARALGFEPAEIHGIKTDNPGDNAERAQSMLINWKQSKGQDATLEVLCKALRNQNVKRTDLAQKMQQGAWK